MSEMSKRKIVCSQILCMIPLGCAFFMLGVARTWIAPIVNEAVDPHSELPLTTEQCSWIASLGYLTRGLSPILLFLTVDKVGRTPIIVFDTIVFFGMWIAVYWSRDILVHYVIRLVCGFADGLQDTVTSIYVCENCSPQYRGTFFTIAISLMFMGQCVAFALATYCSYSTVAIVYAVLGVFTLLSTVLLVEPAQFFLMKGNTTKAVKNFARLRDMKDSTSVKEFEDMQKYTAEEKLRKVNLKLYTSREVTKSLRIVIFVMMLCSGCGWGPIISFATILFSNSNEISANQLSMFYGLLQLVSVLFSSFILDRFNRRTLFMMSASFVCIIHASTVVLYCVQSVYEIPYFQIILFSLVTTFSCISAMFIFPLMGLIRGELLPQSVKTVGAGLSTIVISVTSFAIIRAFLPIAESYGLEINFAIYACSALLLAVYAYFDLPETQGKTLVEIQRELKGIEDEKLEFSHL